VDIQRKGLAALDIVRMDRCCYDRSGTEVRINIQLLSNILFDEGLVF
jgi:hypothetical protein